jgi:uncharacterized protein YqjF (DUF2071 family)
MRKFLTAQWQDLIMANYKVEPSLFDGLVPHGTELDLYQGDCYLSLVAFKFVDTAMMGIKIPFHTHFEEINLRFYVERKVTDEIRRGVVFVKEIVPRSAICLVANSLYGENYERWNTAHEDKESGHTYFWSRGDCENSIEVEYKNSLGVPADESREAFIIEHYWGYTRRGEHRTDEYLVEHPKWELFEVNYAEIDVDFGETYGERFDFLSDVAPDSVLLAKGSEISVYRGQRMSEASA